MRQIPLLLICLFAPVLCVSVQSQEARQKDVSEPALRKELLERVEWDQAIRKEQIFLLVQHADFDFQKEVLPLVEKAFRDGKLPGQNYALLFDRVLIRDGKPQVYGTQAKVNGAEITFERIDDEPNVDKRRREIGLPPISEYQKVLKDVYIQPRNEKR